MVHEVASHAGREHKSRNKRVRTAKQSRATLMVAREVASSDVMRRLVAALAMQVWTELLRLVQKKELAIASG